MSFDPAAWFKNLEATVVTDEQWVVNEIKKGWAALQSAEQTIVVDVNSILSWIQKNQAALQADIKIALEALVGLSAVVPAAAPAALAATIALDATEAAIDALAKHVVDGTTPMSAIVTAYQAGKDAANAVSDVLKVAASKPSTISDAAALQPVPVAGGAAPAAS
jgi:hypothetical protein